MCTFERHVRVFLWACACVLGLCMQIGAAVIIKNNVAKEILPPVI